MRSVRTSYALLLGAITALAPLSAADATNGTPVYTVTVTSAPDLGKVVSAGSGDTVFTINPASGVVTRSSGSGVRLTTSSTRAAVSIKCGNYYACNTTYVEVIVGSIGSPTRRAETLNNFTAAMNSATLASGGDPQGTNPMGFGLNPIPMNTTKTFYLGFDYPIAGDNTGLASGVAASGFYVYAAPYPDHADTGTTSSAAATVYRPLSISNSTGLVFGKVVRPATGSGTVVINASTGVRTTTGNATVLNTPTPSRAIYSVTGEGGQAVSVSVPTSFVMSTTGGTVTVSLTTTASGSQTLSSALGSAGSLGFYVGGTLPVTSTTKDGNYTGTFTVTVQYN